MLKPAPIFSSAVIPFDLPEAGPSADGPGFEISRFGGSGPLEVNQCVGTLYWEPDNHLNVALRIITCGDVKSARIPLDGLECGPHTLGIRWEAERVYLRLDHLPETPTDWIPPGPTVPA